MEAFEDLNSNDQFGVLLDENADMIQHSRDAALQLLEMANRHQETADKYRHLAAVLILEAQEQAAENATLLALEFPMKDLTVEEEEEDDESDEQS
jgi:hypothetical protein